MDTSIKVLVVDDFATMRRILKNLVEADDGTTAWNVLEEQEINLVLADWNMLKMAGLELLKKVRASEKYAKVPFMMVTAEA